MYTILLSWWIFRSTVNLLFKSALVITDDAHDDLILSILLNLMILFKAVASLLRGIPRPSKIA